MYPHVVARRSSLRLFLALLICFALLPLTELSFLVRGRAQGQSQRVGHPRRGKPEGELPNLEDVKNESTTEREPPAAIPSTIRSPKLSLEPWNGRRVGDPEPPGRPNQTVGQIRRAHPALRRAHAARPTNPPLLPDDQFVQNFFTWTLLRSPSGSESTYWNDQLRVAYSQGQTSLKLAAIELGKTLFESAEYAARNRSNHWYVYDLYKTYLMRDPDSTGWTNWENSVPSMGRENVRRGFEESTEFAALIANMTPNGSASANAASLISARVDPRNQPGNGMLTRDASWSVPLLSLPGRAGLDLGLALSYSSMVWTRSGPYIYFDEDNGFPSLGFRLGFPTIPLKVFDAQTGCNSYLLITASGRRVELRQVGTSNIYDATDSSYLRLTESGGNLLVYSTDGRKLTLTYSNNEYRCSEIKDRNGNYITINYNSLGRIMNVTDTLGRVITFNYDSNANLLSIMQAWNGQPSHQWVSFGWGTRNMQSSFTGGAVVGTTNGTVLPVITQVNLNDTSYVTFDYTNSLQVSVIRNYFGAIERNATTFTYETPAGDVPRLLDSRVSARNWTGVNGVPAQVITTYSVAGDGACVLTAPDGTIYKEYYGTGWQRGLTTLSEVWSGGVRQKWITTAWTQDNTSVGYEVNPRVTETNVYDASGNRRRAVIDYGGYAQYGLVHAVHEYAPDGVTDIRQTFIDYNLSQAYLDRRIIGLASQVQLASDSQWRSKLTYDYDDPSRLYGVPSAATQHDVNYNLSVNARGNVTAVSRWDVTDNNNAAKKLTTYTNYYNTGTPISTTDPAGHQSSLTYTDSFSDTINRNTFAFPTTSIDADGFSSYVQYNYDFGATTRTQSPAPAGQSQGVIQTMTYNSLAQLERITISNNGAYKRFWYGADYVASYATVNNVADELYSIEVVDGLGRVIGAASNHPGSIGGYRLVNTIYNQLGQAWKVSNPTEVNGSWVPSGDDSAGMYYTQQTYDWKGRPLVTTNPDNTTKQASYSGCGCAGGEVVTLTDEGTLIDFTGTVKKRQQKIYSDVLGQTWKVEVLNWDGTGPNGTGPNNSVYSTTANTYNAQGQVTSVKVYQGTDVGGAFEETTLTYDGFGRVKTRHLPAESAGTTTTWNYNPDDTVQSIADPRGATATFSYNNRALVTGINYTAPAGITVPAATTYSYDGVGNRSAMTDGVGSISYHYNGVSGLDWEQRTFTGISGTCRLTYGYNFAGSLTSLSEPSQFGMTIGYAYDSANQLVSVSGAGPGSMPQYMSGIQYRAFGATKSVNYGSGATLSVSYNPRMQPSYYAVNPVYRFTYPPGYTTMGTENQYHPDGRIRYARDLQDGTFDRSYFYDHDSRMQRIYTGREARGFSPSGYADCPFQQTYSYDVWNNMSRTGHHWEVPRGDTPSYSNDRRADWTYDASGNVLATDYGWNVHSYNAAGQEHLYDESGFQSTDTGYFLYDNTINQTYDGDGKAGKRVETRYTETETGPQNNSVTTIRYLRSTVLGGAVVIGVDEGGGKYEGHVYAGGQKITDTSGGGLRNVNPVTGAWVSTQYGWGVIGGTRTELDPLGADVGASNPYVSESSYSDMMGPQSLYEERGNPFNLGHGCALDGLPVSCSEAMQRLQSGNAELVVPVNYYVTSTVNGRTVFSGYVGTGYASAADQWRSETTTPGSLTPEQVQQYGSRLGQPGFWADMLNGRIDFSNSYGAAMYSDDVGTHDLSSAYNVNIFGGAASIGQSPTQQRRLDAAKADLRSRLGANNGKNACAALFGGYQKAITALDDTNFSFQNLGAPISATITGERFVHALTDGRNVYINSQGGFMALDGNVPTQLSLLPNTDRPTETAFVTVAVIPAGYVKFQNDVKFAAFVLLHELGHRRGIYGKDNKDAIDDKNGTRLDKTARNNQKILDACFPP
jgi:YD repeat-containing protein